jgi:tRNA modification GTPase
MADCRWSLDSPSGVPGAVALITLRGDIDAALHACGIAPVAVGGVALRDLGGAPGEREMGVVARFRTDHATLMPHGGIAVVRALLARLERCGIVEETPGDPRVTYPEARDEIEARMLSALARAVSPLGVDLLLRQPALWRQAPAGPETPRDRVLRRLIDPPLVVVLGAPNIGKSTLLNELAGRSVSIVSDEPGTTRDHVGVTLDLGGLVVRWVDAPGLREDAPPIEREAIDLALGVARRADLLLLAGDASNPPPAPIPGVDGRRVALRGDLGSPAWATDAKVCVRTGEGVAELVALVREWLVPRAMIEEDVAWRFWA